MVPRIDATPPLVPGSVRKPAKPAVNTGEQFKTFFQDVLEKEGGLSFSRHARERMAARDIPLGPAEIGRLEEAVERAAAKGARDSLVIMDNMAFVVSVKNRMVITAMDEPHLKENVFTKIDSAVIIKGPDLNEGAPAADRPMRPPNEGGHFQP